MSPIISRDDLPETPDWLPESRELTWDDELELARQADEERGYHLPLHVRLERFRAAVKAHAECPAHVSQPLTWDGDDS